MDLTIIIVNWNGGDLLQRCLQSIRESRQSFAVKVIVVDNDSSDGSRENAAAAFPEFTVVNTGANLGFGKGNNFARSMVDTPLVLFLNPDTELKPDTLERAARPLAEDPHIAIVGCKMLYPSGEVQQQGLQWYPSPWTVLLESLFNNPLTRRWLPTIDPHRSTEVRKLYGGFLLCRKDVLDAVGWFDERYFMYAEDVDLCRTVRHLDWKLHYSADAAIIHDHGGVSAKAPSGFSILMKNRSVNQYLRKYQGWPAALLHRLVVLAGATCRLLLLSVAGVIPVGTKGRDSCQRRDSRTKQALTIQWALGFKQPSIPGSVGPTGLSSTGGPLTSVS